MQRLADIAHWLGRKYLFCTFVAVLILIGTIVAKPGTFEPACTALVFVTAAFCGSNTVAGIKGLPGKSAQDAKDGA